MKVIIAEKPSVAREIARVVRATNKKNGYFEGGGYAVTWALGHLITAAMPEAYGIKGFRKENLPILPPIFTLIPRQIKEVKAIKPTLQQSPNSKSSKNSSERARPLSSPPMQDVRVS